MDVDVLRLFDYLATARRHVFGWVRTQRPEVYTQPFSIGHGSIRATLVHIAAAEWAYVERLGGRDPLLSENPFTVEALPTFEPLVGAWEQQTATTRSALGALGDTRRPVEFISRIGPAPMRVRATAGEIVLHMALHEVHHRAQVMAMLRQVGVRAENLDYSILALTRTPLEA